MTIQLWHGLIDVKLVLQILIKWLRKALSHLHCAYCMLGAVGAGLCEQDPILQLYSSSRFFTDSSRPRQRVQDCPHFTKERTDTHTRWPRIQESKSVKVTQSCPTLCNPMAYTVHGILQARTPEWVAFPFSRGSSQPREGTQVSRTAGGFFTNWATREAQEYWSG